MLAVRGLSVRFGERIVLSGIDVVVGDGEIVALVGASGSGKTTLLRAVAGIIPITDGTVAWDGMDLAAVPTHRRGFGLVFQDFALFPHLDVAGNVAFGITHLPPIPRAARVSEELGRVGLSGFEHRRVGELSGGQAQRVAVARSLAPRPRLLLLDEPLGSLDRTLRRDLAADLRAALLSAQIPALHVTHDPAEAFAVADRVVIIDAGRVIRVGTPERVWSAPGTEAAARLLGLTAVVDVTVDRDGVHLGPGEGRRARALVREEAVRIAPDGTVTGTVESSVFRGPGHLVTVRVAGGTVAVASPHPVPAGQTVRLAVDPGAFTLLEV
ncbi:MAG TPA: ABC transporter ATP-binding protein [Acidimicrobiia bacterium]|nr:ABC transporter ATP-binding protein [Acidimicrobiia bacterium]